MVLPKTVQVLDPDSALTENVLTMLVRNQHLQRSLDDFLRFSQSRQFSGHG
jgi:hypothetical protein